MIPPLVRAYNMPPITLVVLITLYSIFFVVGLVWLIAWISVWIMEDNTPTETFTYDSVQAYHKITKVDSTNSYDNLDWVDIKQTFINRK